VPHPFPLKRVRVQAQSFRRPNTIRATQLSVPSAFLDVLCEMRAVCVRRGGFHAFESASAFAFHQPLPRQLFSFFLAETKSVAANNTNITTATVFDPLNTGTFAPHANIPAGHGNLNITASQCGTFVLKIGSCNKFKIMASNPNTPPAAISPLA
jgi:hypothetical protein